MKTTSRIQVLLILGFLSISFAGFAVVRRGNSQQSNSQNTRAEVEAVRRGGLREAARIKGKYLASINTGTWIKYDIDGLTKNSYAIVVGTPTEKVSHLSVDGESIVTDYEFEITETLKGNLYQTQITKVRLPGGAVVFEDGTSAEIRTLDFTPMEIGKTFVLFLTPVKSSANVFAVTGGGQGLFELSTTEKTVKPHGHQVDVVQKHKGERVGDFLQEIRDAVKKYPEVATSCCT